MNAVLAVEIAVSVAVVAAMVAAAVVLLRRLSYSSKIEVMYCALFPLSQILCIASLFATAVLFEAPTEFIWAGAVLGIACIPVDHLLFKALLKAEGKDLVHERARLLEEQLKAQEKGAAELALAAASARAIRRETALQLCRIDESLSRHEMCESERGMDDIVVLMGAKSFRLCEHDAVDALVNMKRRELEDAGVAATFSLKVPRDIAVSSAELCALFANLLDNALHACEEVPESKRFAALRASVHGSYFVVDLSNSARIASGAKNSLKSNDLRESERHIELTRSRTQDGELAEHGWGMSVVELVAERYDGAVSVESEQGKFRTSVMLHLAAHA